METTKNATAVAQAKSVKQYLNPTPMKTKQKQADQNSRRAIKKIRSKRESTRQLMVDAYAEAYANHVLRGVRNGEILDFNDDDILLEDSMNRNPELVPHDLWVKLLQREHKRFNNN